MISSDRFKTAFRSAFMGILLFGFFNCGDSFTCSASSLTTVEYCDLLNNPALYDGKEILLHGIYAVAGKADLFFISSCGIEKRLWVDFNSDYKSYSNRNAIKALDEMRRKSGISWRRPDISALVVNPRSAEVELQIHSLQLLQTGEFAD